jgi:hypothetical protein
VIDVDDILETKAAIEAFTLFDVTGDGKVNIDGDLMCVLAGYSNPAACPGADVYPVMNGDAIIGLDDIMTMARAALSL